MPRFSNVQLIQIVTKAARRVNRELCLFGTADQIVIDSSTGELTSPDDGSLEDLVLLQSECLISQRDYTFDLSEGLIGLRVVDGEQSLDNRQKGVARGVGSIKLIGGKVAGRNGFGSQYLEITMGLIVPTRSDAGGVEVALYKLHQLLVGIWTIVGD